MKNIPTSAPPEGRGWLLDAYADAGGMALWILTEEEERILLTDTFHPCFYIDGPREDRTRALALLGRLRTPLSVRETEKRELFSGNSLPVLEVSIRSPLAFFPVVKQLSDLTGSLSFYNCDIPLPQLYFYERGLFPLAFLRFQAGEDPSSRRITALDSPWETRYALPPLRFLQMELEEPSFSSGHGPGGTLAVTADGERRLLDGDDPRKFLATLNSVLERQDPDLILSEWGDAKILPRLMALSERTRIPLSLNRDPGRAVRSGKDRSFFSYGQALFRAGGTHLSGRWHIDRKNSFILAEAGLPGLFEQARVTGIPLQTLARTSTGTGITSMQMARAFREGILIPRHKGVPESFRSGLDLLETDKGGMIFLPEAGFHESVAELDFASMYPALMTKFNISPETVGCACCPDNRAPETRHTLCTRRKGLIPMVLGPILEKRRLYKELRNEATDPDLRNEYEQRQTALKWLLVVSFGYLGYKNARFGRIEAHECVTAYSREKLLEAKEVAEARGFRLLHGIVDSLWLQKPGMTEEECRALASEISGVTGITINLEGLYRWIAFFPARGRRGLAVPNRYVGVFRSGERKVRGLEVRRSDTPPFVGDLQERLLEHFSRAMNFEEYRSRIPEAIRMVREGIRELRDGRVPIGKLVIRKRLSKNPEEYGKATLQAIVAQEMAARGTAIHSGETVSYIITNARDRDPASRARAYATFSPDHAYDPDAYQTLLLRACEPLLSLSGDLPETLFDPEDCPPRQEEAGSPKAPAS